MRLYETMGCRPTWTCAPYQLPGRPKLGEHVAWAESNAIVFINSVVGARTDRYGDFIDICAAVTGRVPDLGLHRTENRRGQDVFDVSGVSNQWSRSELFWPVLGLLVGWEAGARIPVITGVHEPPSDDQLKAFGAAAASAGSVAMFHLVGTTPEAPTVGDALQGHLPLRTVDVSDADLRIAATRITSLHRGKLAAVSIGTPHFSGLEFAQLVDEIAGRRCHPDVEFYVSTGRAVLQELERTETLRELREFGAEVLVDTCTYVTPVIQARDGVVMTNSAKWAYYAPGNLGVTVVLGSLADCVSSAVSGEIVTVLPSGE
jgi:predicted aconitase